MKNRLRVQLRDRATTFGLWVTLESASVTEIAATLGLDWVCIDLEHGHIDFKEVLEHTRAASGSETTVLVRVPRIAKDVVKRVLDIGVAGVLLPLVESAADVELGFRYARYPPRGIRGIGGERAVRWGLELDEYLSTANDEVLVIPLIETVQAAAGISEILSLDGLEAVFFGPADLSASAGHIGLWEGPGIADEISRIRLLAEEKGISSGVVARSRDDALMRRDQGFRMIGLGSDAGMLIRDLRSTLADLTGVETRHQWF